MSAEEDAFDPGAVETVDVGEWKRRLKGLASMAGDLCSERPKAEEFATSVQSKAEDMLEFLEESGHLTARQQDAIENMEAGIARWYDRD